MTLTAYLRVYQPVDDFPAEEKQRWLTGDEGEAATEQSMSRQWLISCALPRLTTDEGAFVRKHRDGIVVCPWRTRLRMLTGMLAFRTDLPDEIADAFIPSREARQAARELGELQERHPLMRSQILHANWHVPLRWFSAFDDSERILTEDRDGLRIRYETTIDQARARLTRTLSILQSSWIDDEVAVAVEELGRWLDTFPSEGLLELDYGSVASIFPDDELLEDHSATEVWACLEALEAGDVVKAARTFGHLTERWTDVRARELVN